MRLVGGGTEVRRAYSEYLYQGCYGECIPCVQSGRLEGRRVRLGIKDKVVLLLSTPPSAPHSHTRSCPGALLRDAPAAASNSLPDSRIAELPNSMLRGPCPLPTHSLGSRSLFDASIKRTVCCSCISRNQILKMLRQEQYLTHGCLHLEEAKAHVY
jgi:hypothetical protein